MKIIIIINYNKVSIKVTAYNNIKIIKITSIVIISIILMKVAK
jgi:hypothetical protein